jgi:hypothetical protein
MLRMATTLLQPAGADEGVAPGLQHDLGSEKTTMASSPREELDGGVDF